MGPRSGFLSIAARPDSALWAHPAVARQSIVIKGVEKVVCWGW